MLTKMLLFALSTRIGNWNTHKYPAVKKRKLDDNRFLDMNLNKVSISFRLYRYKVVHPLLLAMYKVCWNVRRPCASADILKAFDETIHNGVDVMLISTGPGFTLLTEVDQQNVIATTIPSMLWPRASLLFVQLHIMDL